MEQWKNSSASAAGIAVGPPSPDRAPAADRAAQAAASPAHADSAAHEDSAARSDNATGRGPSVPQQSALDYGLERLPSWLWSLVFHLVALVCLALFTSVPPPKEQKWALNVVRSDSEGIEAAGGPQGAGDDNGDPRDGEPQSSGTPSDSLLRPRLLDQDESGAADGEPVALFGSSTIRLAPEFAEPSRERPASATAINVELKEFGRDIMAKGGVPGGTGEAGGNSFGSRLTASGRAELVRSEGGTPQSERAVGLALHWLAEHQSLDGGWNFDHSICPKCKGRCANPGTMTVARNAATALALLPFLGNGQTHKSGPYKKNVNAGLYFLVRAMHHQAGAGSLHERGGTMYAHGLAAIVLCEAYGMTRDPALMQPAQASLNFIVKAQDPGGGGWRYHVGQAGDTSVVGWQMMALRSGQMSYLQVPTDTLRRANEFLDYVQADEGAAYGYTGSGERPATSAIGLLCRMYLGWQHDNAALGRGVQMLGDWGPSTDVSGPNGQHNNMYYNYYATQVLHHYGGYPWRKWNEVMREYLVATQASSGHEQGSWFFFGSDHGCLAGGRLYCTAMASMILEVYYRHMPLYKERSTQDNFGGLGVGNGK